MKLLEEAMDVKKVKVSKKKNMKEKGEENSLTVKICSSILYKYVVGNTGKILK